MRNKKQETLEQMRQDRKVLTLEVDLQEINSYMEEVDMEYKRRQERSFNDAGEIFFNSVRY